MKSHNRQNVKVTAMVEESNEVDSIRIAGLSAEVQNFFAINGSLPSPASIDAKESRLYRFMKKACSPSQSKYCKLFSEWCTQHGYRRRTNHVQMKARILTFIQENVRLPQRDLENESVLRDWLDLYVFPESEIFDKDFQRRYLELGEGSRLKVKFNKLRILHFIDHYRRPPRYTHRNPYECRLRKLMKQYEKAERVIEATEYTPVSQVETHRADFP